MGNGSGHTPLSTAGYSAGRPQIEKVRYTHDAMIDLLITNPFISQNQIANHFGYTASWVCTIIASDAFQARLALRKDELVDPSIRATIEEKFKALVHQSMEVLRKKLEVSPTDELALGVLNGAAKALGYGARPLSPTIQQNFVVHVPAKATSSAEWEKDNVPVPRAIEYAPVELILEDPGGK